MQNKELQRPKNIPQKAIYDSENKTWALINYKEGTEIPVGEVFFWDENGVLLEEALYGDDGDTRTYKGYNSEGDIWTEGEFQEGVRIWVTYYRMPESEQAFDQNNVPKNAVKLKITSLNPNGYTLESKAYDITGKEVFNYKDTENTYTLCQYEIVKIESALKLENYPVATDRIKRLVNNNDISIKERFETCLEINSKNEEINELKAAVLKQCIEELYNDKKYDEAICLLEDNNKRNKLGKELKNSLWEWTMVLYIKSGKYPISFLDNYFIRRLKHLEIAGKRTSISDFMLEMPEIKAYNKFLKNIPQYTSCNRKKNSEDYELNFDNDVIWDGDFLCDDMYIYYPELRQYKIYTLTINGNFIVKGKISTRRDFSSLGFGYVEVKIKGDVEARSFYHQYANFDIKGNLKAQQYIYLKNFEPQDGEKFSVKKIIDTPLLVVEGGSKLKHKGGFSENCIYIADYTELRKDILVHDIRNIREDFLDKMHYKPSSVEFETLLKVFESRKPIFRQEYDPTTVTPATNIAWEKLGQVKQLIAENKTEEALKMLDSIKESDYLEQTNAAFERDYYKAFIYDRTDRQANAAKINKLSKSLMKLYKSGELISQPKWEMLQFITKNIVAEETVKGNSKKVLELASAINNGDAVYYTQKAELLWESGKKKEALFPTWIATRYYKQKGLKEITGNKEFISFATDCESDKFILPKGYKNSYDKAIEKYPFSDQIDEDYEGTLVYKGDVFWNGRFMTDEGTLINDDGIISEDIFCATLVVIGDLYVKGQLYLHHTNLYITGNLFVESYKQGDSIVQVMGNVFCQNDFQVVGDIEGADISINGNLSATVLAVDANSFEVFGEIDPKALRIAVRGYEFTDNYTGKTYDTEDLRVDPEEFETNDFLNLTEMFKKGTLLK